MKAAIALGLTALALAGCASTRTEPPRGDWSLQASATSGAALVLGPPDQAVLRIACRRNPADLYLGSDTLPPVDEPVRLSVGRHDFFLRSEVGAPHLSAITAPVPDDLPAALMGGGLVRVRAKGVFVLFSGPDAKTAAAFSIACRQAGG